MARWQRRWPPGCRGFALSRAGAVALLALVTLAGCSSSAAPPANFEFARKDGRFVVTGMDPIAGIRVDGSADGADVVGVPRAPAAGYTQVVQFRFRSRGFFTAEPGAHFAVGVTGAWRKDDPATAASEALLAGRGVVIGNVSEADRGCARAPVVEIESFRRDGNRLFASSCSTPLRDGRWYQLTVAANRDGGVGYRLLDVDGRLLGAAAVADRGADIPPAQGGWWLLHVFSNRHPDRDWQMQIADLRVRWLPKRSVAANSRPR